MRQLIAFVVYYKYLIIFPIAIVEGPLITLVSGFLVSTQRLSFLPSLVVVFMGDMVSDSFFYAIGNRGRGFVERSKFLNVSPGRLAKLEKHYETHPGKTIAVAKVSYGVGSLFLVAAGVAKIGYQKFLQCIMPANAVRSFTLMLVGYYLGQAVRYSGQYLRYYTIGVVIALPTVYFIMKRLRKTQAEEAL